MDGRLHHPTYGASSTKKANEAGPKFGLRAMHIRQENDQDQALSSHALRSTRVSISLRSRMKSRGFVNKASAPPSSAMRLVSASP
jgi:hypothetical protein